MSVRIESQAEPIPGYKLLERLGGGGFGEVWKAVAPGGLHKAIKFVYGDLETTTEEGMRAEQELKALSRVKTVRHPYILSLERFDIVDGQLMIVMELADRNLWDRFRECRGQGLPGIPREELLRYMEESAEALDLMNGEYQLQHLDIKPQNIFLIHNHVKVADFGLVKDLEGRAASVTGGVTPVYAAPETFDGWVSRFSDQYSLAIVFQELLTGQRPFAGTNIRQLIMQHLQGQPNLNPLPPADQAAIARSLAKNPDDRFPLCRDLVRTLRGESRAEPAAAPLPAKDGPATDVKPDGKLTHPIPEESLSAARTSRKPVNTPTPQPQATGAMGASQLLPTQQLMPAGAADTEQAGPPSEVHGDGVLFPALVIGLGQLGMQALQQLARALHDHCGGREAMPNLRLLGLDTDTDTVRAVTHGPRESVLRPEEVILAKLGRPSHYLKVTNGRPQLDTTWFDPKMLYRIPRNPATTGVRALGRLAFLDNYPSFARRLRVELEACADLDTLTTAARQTKLGLRSNRPRVYVVCGLGGGTGGGMFLDVAFAVRGVLRQMGYERPDVVGVFFLPRADKHPARKLAVGNTFAALTELNHFSDSGTKFTLRCTERETLLEDDSAPFAGCLLLPLPESKGAARTREATALAAQYLYRDLATPLGRTADLVRAGVTSPPGHVCQTFGLYRVTWPRIALLQRAAGELCRRLVQRWITKDAASVREPVGRWVEEYWSKEEFGAEQLISHLQGACAKSLGQPPETVFTTAAAQAAKALDAQNPDGFLAALSAGLKQVEEIVGRPEECAPGKQTVLTDVLQDEARTVMNTWGANLTEMAVRLIELPEFRLAGAEEALRQTIANVEQLLNHHEPLGKELAARAAEAHSRLSNFLLSGGAGISAARRGPSLLQNLAELLRTFGKWRYQSLVLQRVIGAYTSLRGYLSDQLREINYCRARLVDLAKNFEAAGRLDDDDAAGPGRYFFPSGCHSLDDAAGQLLDGVTADDMKELDRRVQELIKRRYESLVQVCLASSTALHGLERSMQEEAEFFAAGRLQRSDVAEMYLAQYEKEDMALAALVQDFAQAEPNLTLPPTAASKELCILAAPPGPAGERVRALARNALAGKDLVLAANEQDILFYREMPQIPLTALEQLGPVAREAYEQMNAVEHFTPHCRTDITDWHPIQVGRD